MAPRALHLVSLALVAVAAEEVAPIEVKPYMCSVEYDNWENAWTPDWKEWCCTNEQKGCPSTSTTTATSSTTTKTTKTTTTATTTSKTATMTTKTTTTATTTSKTATTTATTTSKTTTKTITTTTNKKLEVENCAQKCWFDGANHSCSERIQWTARYGGTKDKKKPCAAAHSLILSKCDVCSPCELKFARCSEGPPKPTHKVALDGAEEKKGTSDKQTQHKKQEPSLKFRQKFDVPGHIGLQASGTPGLLPGLLVAGFVTGTALLAALHRATRRPSVRAGAAERFYTASDECGEEGLE